MKTSLTILVSLLIGAAIGFFVAGGGISSTEIVDFGSLNSGVSDSHENGVRSSGHEKRAKDFEELSRANNEMQFELERLKTVQSRLMESVNRNVRNVRANYEVKVAELVDLLSLSSRQIDEVEAIFEDGVEFYKIDHLWRGGFISKSERDKMLESINRQKSSERIAAILDAGQSEIYEAKLDQDQNQQIEHMVNGQMMVMTDALSLSGSQEDELFAALFVLNKQAMSGKNLVPSEEYADLDLSNHDKLQLTAASNVLTEEQLVKLVEEKMRLREANKPPGQ